MPVGMRLFGKISMFVDGKERRKGKEKRKKKKEETRSVERIKLKEKKTLTTSLVQLLSFHHKLMQIENKVDER